MLNGLYDKEITEDSPLFREYRTAARSQDEEKTFKILKMILKANPDHASAKRHFGQLSVKIQENKIRELDSLYKLAGKPSFSTLFWISRKPIGSSLPRATNGRTPLRFGLGLSGETQNCVWKKFWSNWLPSARPTIGKDPGFDRGVL